MSRALEIMAGTLASSCGFTDGYATDLAKDQLEALDAAGLRAPVPAPENPMTLFAQAGDRLLGTLERFDQAGRADLVDAIRPHHDALRAIFDAEKMARADRERDQ